MIFYFSGTGNSLDIGKKIHDNQGGEFINITNAFNDKSFSYRIKENEKVGFVFPVYYYGVPKIVKEFIENLEFKGNIKPYIYAVLTCGGTISNADNMFISLFKKRGHEVNSIFSIIMPNNYILLSDIQTEKEQEELYEKAEAQVLDILYHLERDDNGNYCSNKGILPKLITKLAYPLYEHGGKTKKFYSTEKCISCGICEKNCPSKAIEMVNKKPKWVKESCNLCLACIHRCPVRAIEYGKSTVKRGRYVNKRVKF